MPRSKKGSRKAFGGRSRILKRLPSRINLLRDFRDRPKKAIAAVTLSGEFQAAVLVAVLVAGSIGIWNLTDGRPSIFRPGPEPSVMAPPKHQYTAIEVFYATDRAPAPAPAYYGTERSDLRYGRVTVTIPPGHQEGMIERPSIFRYYLRGDDPLRDVTMRAPVEEPYDSFKRALAGNVGRTQAKQLFVFVHGFNVSFTDALMRTGQLAFDLQMNATPVTYTWPSKSDFSIATLAQMASTPVLAPKTFQKLLFNYTNDEQAAANARLKLAAFLQQLSADSGAKDIFLIAHSMGNRLLTRAMERVAHGPGGAAYKGRFKELILTAPDIDRYEFQNDIAPFIKGLSKRTTLYASSNDLALALSKKVHGYRRLGESGPGIVVRPDMDTIDVSLIDTNLGVGHSYFGDNKSVISDMAYLMKEGLPPNRRHKLWPITPQKTEYWEFRR